MLLPETELDPAAPLGDVEDPLGGLVVVERCKPVVADPVAPSRALGSGVATLPLKVPGLCDPRVAVEKSTLVNPDGVSARACNRKGSGASFRTGAWAVLRLTVSVVLDQQSLGAPQENCNG